MNPLLAPWQAPYELPPFGQVRPEHFEPALEVGMAEHRAEIHAIAGEREPPQFENTVAAFDRSGLLVEHLRAVLDMLCRNSLSPDMATVQRRLAPVLAAHDTWVLTHPGLFARIDAVHDAASGASLGPEDSRLLECVHKRMVRAGARLIAALRAKNAEVMQRLAMLQTRFAQNLVADEGDVALILEAEADLDGLPPTLLDGARAAAARRGLARALAITHALLPAFLAHSSRPDLRKLAWKAGASLGMHDGPTDNRPVVRDILQLRHELAGLHGYDTYADFALDDRMAKTPDAAQQLMHDLWPYAKAAADNEHDALQAMQRTCGVPPRVEPCDWPYWEERLRASRFNVHGAELKAYFPVKYMIDAAFDCAGRLFGLCFNERTGLDLYHGTVLAYEVRHQGVDEVAGLLLLDLTTRAGKRHGAWTSSLRRQSRNGPSISPVVVVNANFDDADPVLLALDEVRTLFHEFGHALHLLLSDVTYRELSGSRVARDFVEVPSQLFMRWMLRSEVLLRHARHWRTGEPLPVALKAQWIAAGRCGEGARTLARLASALVDLAVHRQPGPPDDAEAFEEDVLREHGLTQGVAPRKRLAHFRHAFSSDRYAAGYYSYLWADVFSADAYQAFVDTGDPFDPELADRVRRCIYSSGNSVDPLAAYAEFRGRSATLSALLHDRGFVEVPRGDERPGPRQPT